MQMPARGEKYRGPDGVVEVVSSDGAFESKVTVQPEGGGPTRDVPLADWQRDYVYQGQDFGGMKVNRELTDAARRGYEDRVAGRPAGPRPHGAKESDQVRVDSAETRETGKGAEDEDPKLPGTQATRPPSTMTENPAEAQPPDAPTKPGRPQTRRSQ